MPPLVNIKIAVDTPAYGLNTPLGSEITASNWLLSTSSLRNCWCAFDEPNNTPSGTIVAERPPTRNIRSIKATKSSSVFLVFTLRNISGQTSSSSNEPLNGGLARIISMPDFASFGNFSEKDLLKVSW